MTFYDLLPYGSLAVVVVPGDAVVVVPGDVVVVPGDAVVVPGDAVVVPGDAVVVPGVCVQEVSFSFGELDTVIAASSAGVQRVAAFSSHKA